MNPYALLLLIACIVTYALGVFTPFIWQESRRVGKARIIWWDPDNGRFEISFHARTEQGITVGRGESARTYILEARARQPGRWPTWILHPRHGWNWMALSDAETVEKDALLQRLAISNPASYHNQISINKPRQGFRANDPDDRWGWVLPVAIVIGIVILLIAVGVGTLVFGGAAAGAVAPPQGGP